MRYLFFDLELANCYKNDKKICSFGYVLCDEAFKIIEEADLLMNPECKWDDYAIKNVIKHPASDFLNSPTFPSHYLKIKELFSNSIAIGHSTKFDVQALNDTTKRYGLDKISLSYLDIAEIFKAYHQEKNIRGLSKLALLYGVTEQDIKHTSLEDAKITRDVTLAFLREAKLSLDDVLRKINFNLNCNLNY